VAVRGKDTAPELIVRRLVRRMGYRYRLHDRSLPGSPDLVFPSRRKAIFVHGCFWHQHRCYRARGRRLPVINRAYWLAKLRRNRERDRALRRLGWRVIVIWECQARPAEVDRLTVRLRRFLDDR
jgi:DNA mismatch endonuclease (patch repair protein)